MGQSPCEPCGFAGYTTASTSTIKAHDAVEDICVPVDVCSGCHPDVNDQWVDDSTGKSLLCVDVCEAA